MVPALMVSGLGETRNVKWGLFDGAGFVVPWLLHALRLIAIRIDAAPRFEHAETDAGANGSRVIVPAALSRAPAPFNRFHRRLANVVIAQPRAALCNCSKRFVAAAPLVGSKRVFGLGASSRALRHRVKMDARNATLASNTRRNPKRRIDEDDDPHDGS